MSSDVPIDEFLGEAEEIVDSLYGDLITINDKVSRGKKYDPALINNIFRAAHSLKGISGLFGFTDLTNVSHTLESMLDRLRLGKITVNMEVLDLLFESTDMLRAIVAGQAEGASPPPKAEIKKMIGRIENAGAEDKPEEAASDEFLAESEEIIESLYADLISINDAVAASKKYDPALVNNIFRAAHSLKGIAGLFGFADLAKVSHSLETMLDRLRLGKIDVNMKVLDLLFDSVDMLRAVVAGKGEGAAPPGRSEIDKLIGRIENAGEEEAPEDDADAMSCVGAEILAVLTEYEEHRLHENVKEGLHIIKIRAAFDLATFDEGLTELQDAAKALGEIITTLPSAEDSGDDKITFDLILGSEYPFESVKETLGGRPLTFDLLRKGTVAPPEEEAEAPEAETGKAPAPRAPAKAAMSGPGDDDSDIGDLPGAMPSIEDLVADDNAVNELGHGSLKTISQTVRVDIGKLDNLMNIVGELVIGKNILNQLIDRLRNELGYNELVMELIKNTRNMERKLSELQSGVLEVRMVPVGQIFDKIHRNVRKLSRELDKDIDFNTEGADTELDKLIIEDLADPLMHIIRNSIDHGIENKAERLQLGKPERAMIKLSAFQRGNHVVIEVQDDGAGLDFDKIKRKALERGLIEPGSDPRQEELVDFLFHPGFSTAEKVSEISGRGVGLDVVKSNISALSGAIDVESSAGEGTKFAITLPITLAIIQALIVESARETFAIPLNSVQQGLIIRPPDIQTIEGREVIELRGKTLPLLRLDRLFGLDLLAAAGNGNGNGNGHQKPVGEGLAIQSAGDLLSGGQLPEALGGGQADGPSSGTELGLDDLEDEAEEEIYVVKVGIADRGLGIIVDKLWGRQDIVIKSVGEILRGIKGIAGATELGNQRTILVLDVMDLMEEAAVSMFTANN